jgi:secretion/DNA translocation related CpaE-like protein
VLPVLVLTADPVLAEALGRLVAAGGGTAETRTSAAAARWTVAPLVLVGADLAKELAAAGLPRRGDVVLVATDLDDAQVWQQAVAVGADHVVFLPDAEEWLVARVGEALAPATPLAPTLGVIGGRGGAGATTVAVALALAAARAGRQPVLVDADPLSGGADVVLGSDRAPMTWRAPGPGPGPAAAWLAALPRHHGVAVTLPALVGGPAGPAVEAARTGAGLVVVDLPRRLPDDADWVRRLDRVALVVPAEIRAVASAAAVVLTLAPLGTDLEVVVRLPSPSGLDPDLVADAVGLPLGGVIESESRVVSELERGDPPGLRRRSELARFADAYLTRLGLDRSQVA